MMSLKCILSAALLVVGLAAFSAENSKAGTGVLAGEIANVLRDKKFSASVVAGKPAAAVEQLKLLNNKDAQATALLGVCYKEGFGVSVSLPLARAQFLAAAKMGSDIGQFWGGFFLLKGIGGAADVPKAVDLLESSALQGVSNAMLLLAHVYLEGYSKNGQQIIREDHPLAFRYLRRAAAGGNKAAAMVMGDWFLRGGMIKNDPVQAREWFVIASNHPYSAAAVAEIDYENGKDADVKAEAWKTLQTLVAKGNARAQTYVAFVYFKKDDFARAAALVQSAVKQAYPPAFTLQALISKVQGKKEWVDQMVRAAEQGDPEALAHAGFELAMRKNASSGKGVDMLKRAARRGVVNGQVKMGRLCLMGLGQIVKKDETQAFHYFKAGADKGSVEGKYYLAICYRDGLGCRPNFKNAAQYAFEAAQSGDSYAQTLYATFLRDGIGVERDAVSAMAYLEKAVKQDNEYAKDLLADLLRKGSNIENKAVEGGLALVKKSMADGNAASAYAMGVIYTKGEKVRRDYGEGRKHLERAVALKYADAYAALAEYYLNGWGVSRDYKKANQLLAQGRKARSSEAILLEGRCKLDGIGVAKNERMALVDFRQAAAMGNSKGYFWQGFCYAKGRGVAANEKSAFIHFENAARLGDKDSMLMLALFYRDGIGCTQNDKACRRYLEKAGQLGNGDAWYELGLMYANGTGIEKDLKKAVECFRNAAELRSHYGIYELACCYKNGRGVAKDLSKAAALYLIAAKAGNRYAQFMIGRCYEGGIGVPQNNDEALKWYGKARNAGFSYAGDRIKEVNENKKKIIL